MSEKFKEQFNNQEQPETKRRKVLGINHLPNGMTSIDFGPQEEIDGDHESILLQDSTMDQYDLKDKLKKGMEIDVTTDTEGKVLYVKIIE